MTLSDIIVKVAIVLIACAFFLGTVEAQHNHSHGHDVHAGWTNANNEGCCNGHDCGALEEVEERSANGLTEVLVGFAR